MRTTEAEPVRCGRCQRILRAQSSLAAGYGRTCKARRRAEALAEAVRDFTAEQVAKAAQLLADGGLVATTRPGVFKAASTDGSTVYITHYAGCSCPAGTRGLGRLCYHRAAVRMAAVTRKAA